MGRQTIYLLIHSLTVFPTSNLRVGKQSVKTDGREIYGNNEKGNESNPYQWFHIGYSTHGVGVIAL